MPKIARLGDMSSGHDKCPGVPIVGNVSTDVMINGKPVALDGSVFAQHGCTAHTPHSGVVIAPNRNAQINGRNVACVGDKESCGGVIVTGSDVNIGG